MNDAYWDSVFAQFKQAIEKEGGILPSVSVIAERENDPFRVLIATIISLRTKDEVTLDQQEHEHQAHPNNKANPYLPVQTSLTEWAYRPRYR